MVLDFMDFADVSELSQRTSDDHITCLSCLVSPRHDPKSCTPLLIPSLKMPSRLCMMITEAPRNSK